MILAYNTSLADLHIGLFSESAESLAEFHCAATDDNRHIHDALLAQSVSDLLKKIAVSPHDISRIVFINGPGSFTGLRIGLAFAKGMAFGSGALLVPLTAHRVLLHSFEWQHPKLPMRTPILYPGYEKDSVYLSFSDEADSISYFRIADLLKQNITDAICPPDIDSIAIPHQLAPVSLKVMAEIASAGTYDIASASIGSLEPFYGTDFKPHLRTTP